MNIMPITKENIKNINLFLLFFFAFGGYYAVLIIWTNVVGDIASRNFTIPIRIVIVLLIIVIFLMKPKVKIQKGLTFFLIFSGAYLGRIFVEYIEYGSAFHISEVEFFLYFVSFVLAPLFLLSQIPLGEKNSECTFFGLMVGILLLALLTLCFYEELIGNIARISLAIRRGENYISPLALSYCSALGIGIGVTYIITNHASFSRKIFIYIVVGLSFIPFFLGASRGSIVALSFPFVFYFLYVEGIKRRLSILFSILLLTLVFIFLTDYLGSGVFDRFANIYRAIETGSSSAARIQIWQASLMQFFENPVFGNSLNCDYVNHYPHNILLEVMITTGVIGFIPFLLFLQQVYMGMKYIVKQQPQYFWVCVVFIQAFIQNMFSGGIYAAGWFAIGGGLILGFKLKR